MAKRGTWNPIDVRSQQWKPKSTNLESINMLRWINMLCICCRTTNDFSSLFNCAVPSNKFSLLIAEAFLREWFHFSSKPACPADTKGHNHANHCSQDLLGFNFLTNKDGFYFLTEMIKPVWKRSKRQEASQGWDNKPQQGIKYPPANPIWEPNNFLGVRYWYRTMKNSVQDRWITISK